jgi:FKBP-type peptidyl-prolyl cis-trans isomerase (trigger factor)
MPAGKIAAGIELLEQVEGVGPPAQLGDAVTYNIRIYLNRGDEIPINEAQAELGIPPGLLRRREGRVLLNHRTTLGRRQVIAGIEKSLVGMACGGYRRVRVGPHLAYGEQGVPGRIPGKAVLEIELWLQEIEPTP